MATYHDNENLRKTTALITDGPETAAQATQRTAVVAAIKSSYAVSPSNIGTNQPTPKP
jgi:hypothetical protein